MQPLIWYARRLSRMSVPEIAHRIGRAGRVRLERRGLLAALQPPLPDIPDHPGPATFVHVAGIDSRPYERAAERLIAGESFVFAKKLDFAGRRPDWNRDPLTGIAAPLIFGKALDYRDERLVGNIKYLWEPNRHLELVTLAQAYALTDDDRYLGEVGRWLESWLAECPYPKGANWASSLEAGIRLINWSLAWQLIGRGDSRLFSGERGAALRERWLQSVYQHVHFIRHYYSLHSSANNHLIGEAAGLFVATCTWPYWECFEEWGEEAKRLLVEAARTQNHPDGVNREQALAYQQYVLDFFILSGLAGRLAHLRVARLEPALVADRRPHDQRDGSERHHAQDRFRDEEHDADEDDVDHGAHQLVGADVEEALELVDVVVEDREQPTGRLVLEPGQLQALDVLVGVHAGLVLDRLGQVAPEQLGDEVGDRLDDPHADVDRGEDEQLVEPVLDPEDPRDDRLLGPHDHVDCGADQELGHDVGKLVEHAEGHGRDDGPPMPAGVAPQPHQR